MQGVIEKSSIVLFGFGCGMTNAINYVNCMLIVFASENDLELYLRCRDEIMTPELYSRLAAAGLKRQIVSKVWNKDQFRISAFLNTFLKKPLRSAGQYLVNWNVQSS